MSAILQIISHEYRRYIFTTGFLLFLLFVPAMMLLGASAVVLQEATQTVKSFVVIDRDGGWTDVIDAELATDEEDSALELWDNFVMGLEATGVIDPSELPSSYKPGPRTDEERQAFFDQGGVEGAQTALGEISEVQLPQALAGSGGPRGHNGLHHLHGLRFDLGLIHRLDLQVPEL